nr:MAG TPA: hypothetical protein [Caudoviricetes sp.]
MDLKRILSSNPFWRVVLTATLFCSILIYNL